MRSDAKVQIGKMFKSIFNWLIIILIGALLGAFLGVFAVGFFWYFLPTSIFISGDSNPDWPFRATKLLLISCAIFGICCSVAYTVRKNKTRGTQSRQTY